MEILVSLVVLAAIIGLLAWRLGRNRSTQTRGGSGGRPGASKH
ncbi:hypothetical protein [Brevundimonas nasdae]|nr:hypothetical protein [Brevundimonas nasdae]